MFVVMAENASGERLQLTQNVNYDVVQIDGLNPPSATLNTTAVAGFDGEQYNSGRVNTRNVVLTIVINPDIETNRLNLYKIFRTKQYIKLYFKNNSRNVFIDGRIETIECDYFAIRQTMQISMICFQPYFCEVDSSAILKHKNSLLEFPVEFLPEGIEFSTINDSPKLNIVNAGEVETGMFIILRAKGGNVHRPTIYNSRTREKIELALDTLEDGAEIWINTNKGERGVSLINTSGYYDNIINTFTRDSSWLQLDIGENFFEYTTYFGSENLEIEIRFNNKYQGV